MPEPSRQFRHALKEERWLVTVCLFAGLFVAIGLPMALIGIWSVADRWGYPALLPESYTLGHWQRVLTEAGVLAALSKSLAISTVVTILTALLAMPTAWAMARFDLPGKRALELFVLAPTIIPGIVVAVSVGQVFLVLGLAYSIPGVILVQTVGTLPFMTRLMIAAFETLPDEMLQAGRSLGAGPLALAFHIVLPLSIPGLLAGGLLTFVHSFEELDKTFVVGNPVVQTLPIKLYTYLDPYSLQFPLAAIVSLILLLPVLIVFIVSGRILRDDVLAGGMGKV